jgi:hypothetical protein
MKKINNVIDPNLGESRLCEGAQALYRIKIQSQVYWDSLAFSNKLENKIKKQPSITP